MSVDKPWTPLGILLAHAGLIWLFGRVDLLSQLLGAAVPNPVWLLVALVFYALRLAAVFVVPGWLLWLAFAALARKARGRPPKSATIRG